MWRASSTAMRSAADMLELGWPDPAAVLHRMASIRSCWARAWMEVKSSGFTSEVTWNSYPTRRTGADTLAIATLFAEGSPPVQLPVTRPPVARHLRGLPSHSVRVLVTNDDGVESPGLLALIERTEAGGH